MFPFFKWQYRAGAGAGAGAGARAGAGAGAGVGAGARAGAKIMEKLEPELEPKLNNFGPATLLKCLANFFYSVYRFYEHSVPYCFVFLKPAVVFCS